MTINSTDYVLTKSGNTLDEAVWSLTNDYTRIQLRVKTSNLGKVNQSHLIRIDWRFQDTEYNVIDEGATWRVHQNRDGVLSASYHVAATAALDSLADGSLTEILTGVVL
jgi:hypothetical protein